jgi:hypothetical protein
MIQSLDAGEMVFIPEITGVERMVSPRKLVWTSRIFMNIYFVPYKYKG